MSALTGTHDYDLLAELLEYPTAGLVATAEIARQRARTRGEDAASPIAALGSYAAGADPRELEELYARTFDILAPCCLDVGYQLFGENYQRGAFLVRMRQALRHYGISCEPELPDHLPVMLRLLARLTPEDDPRGLAAEAILPAVEKMKIGFSEPDHVYRGLLDAVTRIVSTDFGITEITLPEPRDGTTREGRRGLPVIPGDVRRQRP